MKISGTQQKLIEAAREQDYSEQFIANALMELDFQNTLFEKIQSASDFNNCRIGYGDLIEGQMGTVWIDTKEGTVSLSPQIIEK